MPYKGKGAGVLSAEKCVQHEKGAKGTQGCYRYLKQVRGGFQSLSKMKGFNI